MKTIKIIQTILITILAAMIISGCNVSELSSDEDNDSGYSDSNNSDYDYSGYDYSEDEYYEDDYDYYTGDCWPYDTNDYSEYNSGGDSSSGSSTGDSNNSNNNNYTSPVGSTDGLTFSGTLLVSDTVFEENSVAHISSALISDNLVVIAYADTVNKKGNFILINSQGQMIGTARTFSHQEVFSTSVVKLDANRILIAYGTQQGKAVIINPHTGELISAGIFANSEAMRIKAKKMSNGNTLIAYLDKNNYYKSTYVICDNNGNVVNSPVVLSIGNAYNLEKYTNIDTAILANGNALIIYTDYESYSNKVYTALLNSAGILMEKKLVEQMNSGLLAIVAMSDGGAVLNYKNMTSDKPKFAYYKTDNTLDGPYEHWLTYGSSDKYQGYALTHLPNDFILYCTEFMAYIMDKLGKQTTKFAKFTSPGTEYITAVTFSDGNVLVAFNNSFSNNGKYVVMK